MKYRASLITLTLVAVAFTGCSKHSQDAISAHPKVQELGVIEVSEGVPSQHDLGGGRVCVINPAVQKDGSVMLSMRIEESGRVLASPRVLTRSDMPVQVSVDDIGVGLTPHIKDGAAHFQERLSAVITNAPK